MYNDDVMERQCRDFIRETNREPLLEDEYGRTSAYDALTEAYDLERYPTPRIPKRRPRADRAAGREDGVFSFHGGDMPSCQE